MTQLICFVAATGFLGTGFVLAAWAGFARDLPDMTVVSRISIILTALLFLLMQAVFWVRFGSLL